MQNTMDLNRLYSMNTMNKVNTANQADQANQVVEIKNERVGPLSPQFMNSPHGYDMVDDGPEYLNQGWAPVPQDAPPQMNVQNMVHPTLSQTMYDTKNPYKSG